LVIIDRYIHKKFKQLPIDIYVGNYRRTYDPSINFTNKQVTDKILPVENPSKITDGYQHLPMDIAVGNTRFSYSESSIFISC